MQFLSRPRPTRRVLQASGWVIIGALESRNTVMQKNELMTRRLVLI